MILPERVLGRSAVKMIPWGRAIFPIFVPTCSRSSLATASVPSIPDFSGQPGVVNGASEVLGEIFGDAGRHARSAVGVPVLPLDSPVEVEVIFSHA